MIKFGDIFSFKDQGKYIYLTTKDDGVTIYAAKIIKEPENINELLKRRESIFALRSLSPEKIAQYKFITCFIPLTTENYQDCLAFLGGPDRHGITELEPLGELNAEDIKNLKKEILNNTDVLSPPVIKYVKELEIK